MPELPDVAGFKQYLDQHALEREITDVEVHDRRLLKGISSTQLTRRLRHRTLSDSERHGKFLFVHLSGNGYLILHFGMTGELQHVEDSQKALPAHTRIALVFEHGHRLAIISRRMLGQVSHAEDPAQFRSEQHLGPDALDADRETFLERIGGRRGAVKSTLMDQSILAGIGNVYADEILFQARLHPKARLDQLDEDQLKKLYQVTRRVLKTAARHGGDASELPRRYLLPHRGTSDPCPECGGAIKKITVAGRSSYYCPQCQKSPK